MAKAPKVRVVTPAGIAAFAWVHKPDTGHKYSNNKYKLTLVLDDESGLADLKAKAIEVGQREFPGVKAEDFNLPYKSGDGHKKEEFHGKVLLNAGSKFQPTVVDTKRKPLPPKVEVRSGDEVRLVVNLYPYTKTEKVKEGKKIVEVQSYGVSAQLDVVQLVRKNAGGGGVDLLDEIDGYEGDDLASVGEEADTGTEDNGGDF